MPARERFIEPSIFVAPREDVDVDAGVEHDRDVRVVIRRLKRGEPIRLLFRWNHFLGCRVGVLDVAAHGSGINEPVDDFAGAESRVTTAPKCARTAQLKECEDRRLVE